MTGAASTSETSVNLYQTTRRYNPQGTHSSSSCAMQIFGFSLSYKKRISVIKSVSTGKGVFVAGA
jgi:hypothetical protein